ncbi:HD domain-containing phosphohydrolase [Geminocystis sp. GBBB08]|uniref:HD domain-containing phosphohydrolase n=1 Tax=Geminocystis sp. GBBB08 TaxID=2604140 RepID=UPI0027E38C15|nr:HD domain-containing phosphohydrolase [Geminocystis sp. GBBB08]MBL1208839.1 histidine kinase [Geminocystis sp. GBBB08]
MPPESTLHQLRKNLPEGELPSSYGVYYKNTLVALCHALEDHILQHTYEDEIYKPLVLVTFQRGKWYIQEADRYWDLAQHSRQVAIAAVADSGFASHRTSQLENVDLVHLREDDSFVEEWNLVILAPDYAAMVLCHELSPEEYKGGTQPQIDTERKFYGLWTFDRNLVEKAVDILTQRMKPYNVPLGDKLEKMRWQIKYISPLGIVDLTGVVSRIISYLQTSQQELVTVNRQTRELRDLEGQALKLSRNLAASKLQAFLRMAQKVDNNDPFNSYASLQVAALAETLGQILDLPTLQLRRLRLAGLLFRIGLAEAPTEIFTSSFEQFNSNANKFWRDRSVLGAHLLASMSELEPITKIVYHQLEYWDGSGNPDGLKAEEIPLESRILGLVSYFQELTQTRGDRQAYSLGEAFDQCEQYSNIRFDPSLVDSLKTVIRLTEMGLMQLPDRPSQLPPVWLNSI